MPNRTYQLSDPEVYQRFGPYGAPYIIDPAPQNVTVFGIDSSTGTVGIYLPTPSTVPAGRIVTVKDEGNSAATSNITVYSNGGTIESPSVINVNSGFASWYSDGVSKWHLCDNGISSGGGTPGGADTQIQYNNAGAFGGDAGLTWNATNGKLTITMPSSTGSIQGFVITDTDTGQSPLVIGRSSGTLLWQAVFPGTTNTQISMDAGNGVTIAAAGYGVFFGDINGDVNGNRGRVDDANNVFVLENVNNGDTVSLDTAAHKTTSNVKHEASGNITVMTNGQGLHQQSPNGHYWRQDVSNLGVATWTDIGTSPP